MTGRGAVSTANLMTELEIFHATFKLDIASSVINFTFQTAARGRGGIMFEMETQ